MSLSDENIKGNKTKKTMNVFDALYRSWGAMIKYVKDSNGDVANQINIVVRAHHLPFEDGDDKFTVGKLLQLNLARVLSRLARLARLGWYYYCTLTWLGC